MPGSATSVGAEQAGDYLGSQRGGAGYFQGHHSCCCGLHGVAVVPGMLQALALICSSLVLLK